ncbi:MAG: acyl-CoA synthetase (AMP-forming)/AMP-acid ligase [Ilumatobacteraceae bacterium]|nr:acyl-CoA synthetase (AMP-forming)/AMP-acid ligase [Ilumatobacteraceae bacterium]
MNLASIIDPHPDDATALISRGRATTYGELREQVGRLRGGLIGLGIDPGDRIGIICANNWYFVTAYLAVLGAGAVAVPLNPLSPPRELERELAAVGARAMLVGPAGRATADGIDRSKLPVLEFVIHSEGVHGEGAILLDDLLTAAPLPVVEREPDDLAVLIFTSGTAGSPKAAMLSHGNLLANLEQTIALRGEGDATDVGFGVLPMFHIFGLNVVLGTALHAGASVLLVERFDPMSALEAIHKHGVTVLPGAPQMWAAWAAMPGLPEDSFATVKVATSGAAHLDPHVAETIRARFGLEVGEGYGLTEASPVVTASIGLPWRPGSVGAPVDGVEVRLVDAEGEDVLVGDPGEIWVQGPNVFQGYWNDAEATRACIDEDGWLRTGDIAMVDDEGFLFLVDRAKDLIIVSGFNVFPAEVEEVLLEMDGVAEVAVVGVPHPHTGEAVKAFVVVEPGHSLEEDSVIEFAAQRLARYKCPQKVNFVDELPQNLSGKVLRRALR